MSLFREQTDLDKKPIWYLFLIANVIVLLGTVITFLLFNNKPENTNFILFVPSIVCNLVGLAICALFIYLEAKTTMPKIVHFQRKWLWWYLSAIIVFVVAIIFNFIYLFGFNEYYFAHKNTLIWPLWIYIAITAFLTLVSIGLQRYARYKIDLDMYKRKQGELPKKEEIEKDQAKAKKAEAKKEGKQPTSGLADSITNK